MEKIYPLNDGIGYVSLVDRMQENVALKIVNAARASYGNSTTEVTDKDKKLIDYLYTHEHTSPFRHSYFTFEIKAPLFVFRQWIKYQVGSTWRTYEINGNEVSVEFFDLLYDTDKGCSWNELSGRYKEFDPEFYVPKLFNANSVHGSKQSSTELGPDFPHETIRSEWIDRQTTMFLLYKEDLKRGIAKEQCRMNLPQSIYTCASWTVSLQALMHFLDQRLANDAQFEIRAYANAIKTLVNEDLSFLKSNG